jgi:hypothetical protein
VRPYNSQFNCVSSANERERKDADAGAPLALAHARKADLFSAHSERVILQVLDQPRLAIGPTPSLIVTS